MISTRQILNLSTPYLSTNIDKAEGDLSWYGTSGKYLLYLYFIVNIYSAFKLKRERVEREKKEEEGVGNLF